MPDTLIRRIASVAFPGAYLQMNGHGISTFQPQGGGPLSAGHGAGPLEQFKLSPPPVAGSPYVTSLESVAHPGVYMGIDGNGIKAAAAGGGGRVSMQFGSGPYEKFIVRQNNDQTISLESQHFPGIFLRFSLGAGAATGESGIVVNAQFGAGPYETFRLEPVPAAAGLRVLTYNTHLMENSFIETGADIGRAFKVIDRTNFEDGLRREYIKNYVLGSLADIVCLQEVWAVDWQSWFGERLAHAYPFSYVGDPFITAVVGTSGLVLFSKYPLSERYFKRLPGMTGSEALSNKGVLAAVADIPNYGKLRIGVSHTAGELTDVDLLANATVDPAHVDLPAVMMGDLNIHWRGAPERYSTMRSIFAYPNRGIYPATDAWLDVHGTGTNPDPYTVQMRLNPLAQIFSPERDTEGDDRLDYFWVRDGKERGLSLKSSTVPRNLKYTSNRWLMAHRWCCADMPSAAVLGDLICVVARNYGNNNVLASIYNRSTQMWRHVGTGFSTGSASSPGIIVYEGKFHVFHQHDSGNAIFHRSSTDGEHWSNWENVGFDTGGAICPVLFGGKLHLFYVDSDAKGFGGQIRYRVKERAGDVWSGSNAGWSNMIAIGITTRRNMSAAVLGDRLCVVTKDNGEEFASAGVMYATCKLGGKWECGHPDGLVTSGAPGIVAHEGRFHLYYRHHNGNAIYHAWSTNGKDWNDVNRNTEHDSMIGGVCPLVFDGKTLLFYPYHNTNKGSGYYQARLMLHSQMPDIPVDLSDHYPLLIDAELIQYTTLCRITPRIQNMGDVTYRNNVWAGRKDESLRVEGFSIKSEVKDLGFSYMAHIQDQGDSGWVNDSQYVGTQVKGKGIEGFAIRLTGAAASQYKLTYRAYLQGKTETPITDDGQYCGTKGQTKPVEAIWINLVKK